MSDQESRIEQLIAAKKKADAEVAKRISATKDEHILRTQAWSKVRRDVVEPAWETGETSPSIENLCRIINATGAKLDSFFGEAEPAGRKG